MTLEEGCFETLNSMIKENRKSNECYWHWYYNTCVDEASGCAFAELFGFVGQRNLHHPGDVSGGCLHPNGMGGDELHRTGESWCNETSKSMLQRTFFFLLPFSLSLDYWPNDTNRQAFRWPEAMLLPGSGFISVWHLLDEFTHSFVFMNKAHRDLQMPTQDK